MGASGYSGLELTRLLLRHPHVKIESLFANTSAGKRVAEVYPWLETRTSLSYSSYSPEAACTSDLVFVALPSGEAMHLVPELLQKGKRIIDLGGDFRLSNRVTYEQYYRRSHTASGLLGKAVYGLPELHREEIRSASFIANPGCYPTGAILPLAPLLKKGLIRDDGIIVSALSGVSGAGRSGTVELSFTEVNESVKAYKPGTHQHIPEINQALTGAVGRPIAVTFVPHLIPITRGIYTTIYALSTQGASEEDILDAYRSAFAHEPFVRISSGLPPEIKNVAATNFIDIGFRVEPGSGRVILFSVIDNLLKGAAGQAVQNMNLIFGLNETEGLL